MRITELMADFRNILHRIAAIRAQPSREEYNEEGFVLLRQSQAEAKAILSQPFEQASRGRGTEEHHKVQLKRCAYPRQIAEIDHSLKRNDSIIIDAAVRRHRAQKAFLQATAALRWVNARASILQGQRPQAGHAPALQHIRNALRAVSMTIAVIRKAGFFFTDDQDSRVDNWLDRK